MSQLGGLGATPARRSVRISQAGSVTNQSVLTAVTTGGTSQRRKGPLAKVKSRKSNAYGASGRVGAAEELSLSATNFAQAFQNQRGDAVARDDDDDETDETDENDVDELSAQTPRMSGGLNGRMYHGSSSPGPEDPNSVVPGLSFEDSDDMTPNENDPTASFANTSKSFGLGHEAGMLSRPLRKHASRASSEESYGRPLWQRNMDRRLKAKANVQQTEIQIEAVSTQVRTQATPAERAAIEQSVDELVAEEQARLQREGPPQPRSLPRRQNPHPRLNNPRAVNEWLGNIRKGHGQNWSWRKYLTPLLSVALSLAALSMFARSTMSDPHPDSAPRTGLMTAVNTRISRTWYDIADWVMPAERDHKKQEQETSHTPTGDFTHEDDYLWAWTTKNYRELDSRIGTMGDAITQLREDLPQYIVVRRLPDGTQELTDEFWNALVSKVNSPSGSTVWNEYIKNNEAKLRDIFGFPMNNGPLDPRPEAVSRAEFVRTLESQYQSMSAHVDKKILESVQGLKASIKTVAQAEAKRAMVDSVRLDALAQSNLLANYELNLRKANYFSPGLGAIVDPGLTSATFLDEPRPLAKYVRWLALVPQRNPPQAALEKWEEPGDCWCAAPNPALNGQAQLVVALSRPMFPQQVTIEHVPMSMMPDKKITNAPRRVELWVESDHGAQYQYSHRSGVCQEGPAGWTCLGSFTYNIHGSNHQQTFDLDAQSSAPVKKVMLRVTSNWGADHTCMYRARLHGRDAVEDYQYDTRLNDPAE